MLGHGCCHANTHKGVMSETQIVKYHNCVFCSFWPNLGVGSSLVFMAGVVAVTVRFQQYRTIVMGATMSGLGLGHFIYPFVASVLMDIYGWRGALLVSSGIILNACVCGILIGKDPSKTGGSGNNTSDPKQVATKPKSVRHLFLQCNYWSFHLHTFLLHFSLSILGTHIIAYAQHNGHSQWLASSLLSAIGISGLVGRILHGIVIHSPRVNTKVYYLVCCVIVTLSVLVVALWTGAVAIMIAVVVAGVFFSAKGPVACEIALQLYGQEHFAYAFGFLSFSSGAGYVLGAPCAGVYMCHSKQNGSEQCFIIVSS